MKRNEGFSLVELIVVIAILAILSTAAVMGVGMIGGWRMNECVSLLDSGLKEARTEALSKQRAYFVLSCDANGNYFMQVTGHPEEKVAGDGIVIRYTTDAAQEAVALSAGDALVLTYDRASGAFLPVQEWNADRGEYLAMQMGSGEHVTYVYCTSICVELGEGRETTIRLAKSTGKHTIE